jgi:hypothetical protein
MYFIYYYLISTTWYSCSINKIQPVLQMKPKILKEGVPTSTIDKRQKQDLNPKFRISPLPYVDWHTKLSFSSPIQQRINGPYIQKQRGLLIVQNVSNPSCTCISLTSVASQKKLFFKALTWLGQADLGILCTLRSIDLRLITSAGALHSIVLAIV